MTAAPPSPPALPGLAEAVALIRAHLPQVSAVYLYGSRARGDARPDSDVDLAVFTDGRSLSALELWDVHSELFTLFDAVDLVHLDRVSTVLQREVVVDGLRLYAADARAADNFEIRALREYADLMQRRREIDADIVKRGRVLGHV